MRERKERRDIASDVIHSRQMSLGFITVYFSDPLLVYQLHIECKTGHLLTQDGPPVCSYTYLQMRAEFSGAATAWIP